MLILRNSCAVATSLLIALIAFASEKRVVGMEFSSTELVKSSTLSPFRISLVQNPFFAGLREIRKKKTVEYRRGNEVVSNFPDEITVKVEVTPPPLIQGQPGIPAGFKAEGVKFSAAWNDGTRTVAARGMSVVEQTEKSPALCEDACGGYAEFELRIESAGRPLTDRILIRIDTTDGHPLGEYAGVVSTKKEPDGAVAAK